MLTTTRTLDRLAHGEDSTQSRSMPGYGLRTTKPVQHVCTRCNRKSMRVVQRVRPICVCGGIVAPLSLPSYATKGNV